MRVLRKIQETNFELLTKEILSKGVTAALPKNLPDRWLRTLGRDVVRSQKAAMAGKNTTNDIDIAGPFFLAVSLLSYKKGVGINEHSDDEVVAEVQKYSNAILSEIIARQTGELLMPYDISTVAQSAE